MRERLTASFVLLAVVLLLVAGLIRSYTLGSELRERESARLHQEAVTIARLVDDEQEAGRAVDEAFLATFVHAEDRVAYLPATGEAVEVRGSSYEPGGDELSAGVETAGGRVTVSAGDGLVWHLLVGDPAAVLVLVVLAVLGAGCAGVLVARALSAPFRQLAGAASALGRGRFDLDLPDTRIPEAVAISQSLSTSADQLRERLRRDQAFAAHTSHALRSPLTGLRLELEEVALREDLPADVRETVRRALAGIEKVDRVAGELVALQRGSLVEGAEIALRDLATQVAQRWADGLAVTGREVTAAAEGDLDLRYTPGPVEHLLDLVLAEMVTASRGAVRLVLRGEPGGHLRISVTAERSAVGDDDVFGPARSVCAALGGRWQGSEPMDGLEVLLPRR
jgi:signal transduction histidine kinase